MQQVNIRWVGPPGLIVARRITKGATVEAYTGLLEVSVFGPEDRGGGEYIVTSRYSGRVEWVHAPGVTIPRGKVVARIWADGPAPEGAVSAWEVAREPDAKATQAIPVPYALNTPSPSQSVRMGEGAGDWARARAKAMGMGVGPFFDLLVYTFATMPESQQEEVLRRFTKALEA